MKEGNTNMVNDLLKSKGLVNVKPKTGLKFFEKRFLLKQPVHKRSRYIELKCCFLFLCLFLRNVPVTMVT